MRSSLRRRIRSPRQPSAAIEGRAAGPCHGPRRGRPRSRRSVTPSIVSKRTSTPASRFLRVSRMPGREAVAPALDGELVAGVASRSGKLPGPAVVVDEAPSGRAATRSSPTIARKDRGVQRSRGRRRRCRPRPEGSRRRRVSPASGRRPVSGVTASMTTRPAPLQSAAARKLRRPISCVRADDPQLAGCGIDGHPGMEGDRLRVGRSDRRRARACRRCA